MPDFPVYDRITPVKSPVTYQGYGAGAAQIRFFRSFLVSVIPSYCSAYDGDGESDGEDNRSECAKLLLKSLENSFAHDCERKREEEKTFRKYFSWRTELAAMGSGFGEDWKSISEDTNVIDHHKAPQATPRQEANRDNMECNIPKEVPESNNDGHIKSVSQWRTVTLHPQVQVDAPDANPPNPKLVSHMHMSSVRYES